MDTLGRRQARPVMARFLVITCCISLGVSLRQRFIIKKVVGVPRPPSVLKTGVAQLPLHFVLKARQMAPRFALFIQQVLHRVRALLEVPLAGARFLVVKRSF